MNNIWQKHPFKLLLYLEWVLLGIALLTSITSVIPHRNHSFVNSHALNWSALFCIALLGFMGLKLPLGSKLISYFYIFIGLILSWVAVLFIARGERIFPALLLIVVIRSCLLFGWRNRIFVAIVAYLSFLALQIMSLLRINPFGVHLGRPLPRVLRRLPPEELQRVLFSLAFNSAFLFALVLAFVLLLVGAVLAEHQSRAKLVTANQRLREYALKIENQATLQERNRIAREIHDSVGHYLTAQSIQLENTALFFKSEPNRAANHLSKARQLGKEALTNIRASVATLRKNSQKERSLKLILEQLITEFKANTSIEVSHNLKLTSNLSTEVTAVLYRIVQEALTNIAKHSQSTKVNLDINKRNNNVVLTIQDNGCGFNPKDNTTGFGLQGMAERAEALSGSFMIESELGKGCQIKAEIPIV